jgi:hypothetical protein
VLEHVLCAMNLSCVRFQTMSVSESPGARRSVQSLKMPEIEAYSHIHLLLNGSARRMMCSAEYILVFTLCRPA